MSDAPVDLPAAQDKGAPKWMVTFGDLMSLLLCFFVLLLSFSEIDRQKYKQVAGSLAEAFGVQRSTPANETPKGVDMVARDFNQDLVPQFEREEYIPTQADDTRGEELKKQLEVHLKGLEDQVEVEATGDRTIIRLLGGGSFDSGEATIRPELLPVLGEIGARLRNAPGDIIVAGHTDNVPVRKGPFGTNLKLSIARAAEVAQFLIDISRVDPRRISTMGFGMYRPQQPNDTEEGREQNRRVEIILTHIPLSE
jgi:chemotaxis protein MotB